MSLTIMQGDQYALMFTGKLNGQPLDMSMVEWVEIVVGNLRKVYPGEVTVDDNGKFRFPLTQEETFAFRQRQIPWQARVKFTGSTTPAVFGSRTTLIRVEESLSKEVL